MRELTESEIALFDSTRQIPNLQKTRRVNARVAVAQQARQHGSNNMRSAGQTRKPRWSRGSHAGGALPA